MTIRIKHWMEESLVGTPDDAEAYTVETGFQRMGGF